MGTLEPYERDDDLPPGEGFNTGVSEELPEPGEYPIYATLESGHATDESNEDDNENQAKYTTP